MDGVLLIHAKTGHILFSKAYTEGFGLQLKGESDDSNVSAPKDPLIASMLLANFLCAFYTNVLSLLDESALPPDASMTDLLRQPLQSLDTGANGPMVFFHRHADTNVLCALFLKRALLVDAHAPGNTDAAAPSPPTDVNGIDAPSSPADSHERRFQQCGDWLAQQTLTTFVHQFRAELAARPFRASTKVFKPFLGAFETLYTATFSTYLLQSAVDHLARRWQPKWMYVIYSEEFCRGMDKAEGVTAASAAAAAAAAPVAPKPKFARPSSIRVADASLHGDVGIVPSSAAPSFIPHPPATPAPAHAVASRSDGGSSSNSFFAARPVSTRTLHPFRPKVRRWWHFGSGSGKDAAAPPLFYAQLGRTTCFYQFKGDNPEGVEALLKGKAEEEDKTSADPLPKKSSAPPSSAVDLSSVPSADALRQLVALVHQAGVLLAQPTEVADQLNWMEVQLKPSASSPPGNAKSAQKLWVLRIQDLLLCFPTSSNPTDDLHPSSSTSSAPCSFPALLSSFHPFLACLAVHYACVSTIHERQYRTLQKNMEKQQAATKAATAAAK